VRRYLVGGSLMRNSYVQPAGAPCPGCSGNRDFSRNRVEPAPASSFAVPTGCSKGEAVSADEVRAAFGFSFGDGF
jgi:hypothetical protein